MSPKPHSRTALLEAINVPLSTVEQSLLSVLSACTEGTLPLAAGLDDEPQKFWLTQVFIPA